MKWFDPTEKASIIHKLLLFIRNVTFQRVKLLIKRVKYQSDNLIDTSLNLLYDQKVIRSVCRQTTYFFLIKQSKIINAKMSINCVKNGNCTNVRLFIQILLTLILPVHNMKHFNRLLVSQPNRPKTPKSNFASRATVWEFLCPFRSSPKKCFGSSENCHQKPTFDSDSILWSVLKSRRNSKTFGSPFSFFCLHDSIEFSSYK